MVVLGGVDTQLDLWGEVCLMSARRLQWCLARTTGLEVGRGGKVSRLKRHAEPAPGRNCGPQLLHRQVLDCLHWARVIPPRRTSLLMHSWGA